jgi:serine phosphatase RsbU (regulator of sigma subunit)
MVSEERHLREAERASLVTAARAHSAAVAAHLDRVAGGLRVRPVPRAAPGGARPPAVRGAVRAAVDELSRLLLAERSLDGLLDAVLDLARRTVDPCDGASLTLVHAGHAETAATTDPRAERSDRCQYDLREGPCWEAATTGRVVLAEALPDARWARFSDCAASQDWGGLLSVPLVVDGDVIGGLNLYASQPNRLGTWHTSVAAELAEHAALAVVRARDSRDQQAAAATFQRFLLPASLPVVPGLALTARYQPASTGINVGGDWYDVLQLDRGRVALVIGDVAGHGLAASMTMGQLRTAVRAYALEHARPADILRLTADFLLGIEPEGYATCCVVLLDPGTGEAAWCSAGHPPPVLVDTRGSAHPLPDGGEVPALGVPVPGAARAGVTGHVALPAGSRLLLYTDGLVERRGEDPDAGLARLLRVAGRTGEPLEQWCDAVVARMLSGRQVGDDVAVLAVELGSRVPA